ncbi:MFS transporter [candidate division KSB1 bacterium]|nr:MFS transporter [candidate division KSB1 bacterium]
MKKMTAVVALMAVFTLAICFNVIGAVSVELMDKLGFDIETATSKIGSMAFALFLTATIVQLFIGPLVDKFGHKPLAIIGFIVTSASMFLLAFAPSFILAMLASVFLGIGAMCLNTVGNTLIPVVLFNGKDPARAGNFGNGFFGLGLIVTPFLVSIGTKAGLTASMAVTILGVLVLIFLIFALLSSYPQVSTGYKLSEAFKLLGEGAVILAALALFCYISLESTMNTWIKPYMTEMLGGSKNAEAVSNAGLVLGFFGVAMMIGRFLASAVKNLTAIGTKVIAGAAVVSVITIVLMIVTKSPALAVVAVIVTGLAFAPIFPTVVGVTFAKFEPKLYGSIFGIIFAIGLLGGTFIPKFIGNLAEGKTVQQSLPIAAVMAGILIVIAILMGLTGKKAKQ